MIVGEIRDLQQFWRALLVSLALSVTLVWISHSVTFNHLAEGIQNQYATIRGLPFVFDGKPLVIHPFYNRILFPAIFVFVANNLSGWTNVQVFLFLRFLSFVVCFITIFIAISRGDCGNACSTVSMA